MGVYSRYKRNPDGLRCLVELLESTPVSRRQRMIEVGLAEDPVYTRLALSLTLSFQEILGQPDLVIAEVCAAAQARTVGRAIARSAVEIQRRFLRCCSPGKASEVREIFSEEVTLREVGGAQLQMVVVTRELERKGVLQFKRIPLQTVLVG